MNLLSLVGPRLDNIYQIRRKWYYSSGWKNFQSKRGPDVDLFQMHGLPRRHITSPCMHHACRFISLFYLLLLFSFFISFLLFFIASIYSNNCGHRGHVFFLDFRLQSNGVLFIFFLFIFFISFFLFSFVFMFSIDFIISIFLFYIT
jgi:hypothetical protein